MRLPDYRLLCLITESVFTDNKGNECVFKGEYAMGRQNIYLLLFGGHFHTILFPKRAFDYQYVCDKCVVFYNHKGEHMCEGSCWRCLGPRPHEDPTESLKRCPDCGHKFVLGECPNNHKTLKIPNTDQTKCSTFKFCLNSETSYSNSRGKQHVCGFVYCNLNVENHLCFMQKWEPRQKRDKYNYCTIWYDI